LSSFFFFNYPTSPEIYTLSLHDALPISARVPNVLGQFARLWAAMVCYLTSNAVTTGSTLPSELEPGQLAINDRGAYLLVKGSTIDRKSTRLNSSHVEISYAVFCLKKKKK